MNRPHLARPADAPLLVTALLDAQAFAVLDGLRRRHFPTDLNRVPAHLSLFHNLPGEAEAEIVRDIEQALNGRGSFVLRASGLTFLGRGVAISYEAGELEPLRAALVRRWSTWLTAQDRQPFRPHVTIQNKVAPDRARALHASMQGVGLPDCRIEGLAIWRYLGGPWQARAECRFALD